MAKKKVENIDKTVPVLTKTYGKLHNVLPVIPRTHKICDIKNFGTKFCPNLTILVFLKSWRRDLSKFGETKLRRYPKFAKIENLSLGLRIQNLDLS